MPKKKIENIQELREYSIKNFEQLFVLLTLVTTALLNYFIPQKASFLNFYYLPIILGGYYLGRRKAVMGALFCVVLISGYVYLDPEAFYMAPNVVDLILHVSTWACFLILAGAVVGGLQEKLMAEVETTRHLNMELQKKQQELVRTNVSLEQSKRSVESLKAKVEEALYSTMDASVANLLIEGRLRNEKRNVSILFSDLVGFTSYSEEHPPEVVIRDLNRFLSDTEPILIAYRGHIDKYMGDGVICEFGAPFDYETYRLLAVLAGLKLQEKLAKLKFPWQMRVGIASGAAITGLIGSKRQTYTAIGDTVNLAARLEKACTPGRVLIDRETYDNVSRFIEARKKRDIPTRDSADHEKERELEALHEKVSGGSQDADLYFHIGNLHLELKEAYESLYYFERAMELVPGNMQYKVAYAEAGIKAKDLDKLSIKGKRHRVEAYEVTGLKDPLEDRNKIPLWFYNEYKGLSDLITIPNDVVLPVEALDGSIGHSRVVAVIAGALGGCFGLTEREKLDILHAGYVADIGKEIVSHYLLNRRGGLTAGELEVARQHSVEGTKILRKMGYESESIIKIVYHSHEHFNGAGYPSGLKEGDIPLGSRIVAVADAYDALTAWRPYRDAWERHAALEEITRGVERGLYDPKVVDILVRLLS